MDRFIVDFRKANIHTDLAGMIGCPVEWINLLAASKTRREFYYEEFVPKKNARRRGQYRRVWAGSIITRYVHQGLFRKLEDFLHDVLSGFPHPAVHGYVRRKSIVSNATPHCGNRILLRADIEKFFESIPRTRVERLFESVGIPRHIAETLGAIVTVEDVLGQGINTSPLLANAVCMDLDDEFTKLAESLSCRYTRYADDISFSGDGNLPQKILVSGILERHGFHLSDRKFRMTKLGQAHFVTGLSVSDASMPRAPRTFKRQLRQELYYASRHGVYDHADRAGYPSIEKCVNTIDGRISYLRSIEPTLGGRMNSIWQEILERDRVRPNYSHAELSRAKDVFFYVDESVFEVDNQRMLALCLVLVEDTNRIKKEVGELRARILADPFASGRKRHLTKKGFHFADDAEDTRTQFTKLIAEMPIRSFIAYSRMPSDTELKPTYLKLLRWLLTDRLAKQYQLQSVITVEENPKIKSGDLERMLDLIDDDLKLVRRQPAFKPKLVRSSKMNCPLLAICDYIIGVTGRYMSDEGSDLASKRFERLRDKVRLVMDADTGDRFWRKNPFESKSLALSHEEGSPDSTTA